MNVARVFLLALAMAAVTGSGCSHRYVLTTTSGSKIVTTRKPKLVDAMYIYKDGSGRTNQIPAMRVRVIEPYSKRAASGGATTLPELQ